MAFLREGSCSFGYVLWNIQPMDFILENNSKRVTSVAEEGPFEAAHTPIPATWGDATIPDRGDIANMITVTDLKIKRLSWII